MKNEPSVVGTLMDKAEAYGETSIELFKLKAVETTVEVASSLSIRLLLFAVALILVLMLNIAIAFWIGEYYHKASAGFFVVTAINAVILLIGFLIRKNHRIEDYFSNLVLKQIYKNKDV